MRIGEAKAIAGSLGFPSKMPGTSYGLPASACIAGAQLAKIPDTICSECYALSGKANYQMPRALIGQERRLAAITHPQWIEAMVTLLRHYHAKPLIKVDLGIVGVRRQKTGGSRYQWNQSGYHRWHDSGDIQSLNHFVKIVEIARQTPDIRHWIPTRETAILRQFQGELPSNLLVRVSATMIGAEPPRGWKFTSTVHSTTPLTLAHECPAPNQDHRCGNCRACWSRNVPLVSYLRH